MRQGEAHRLGVFDYPILLASLVGLSGFLSIPHASMVSSRITKCPRFSSLRKQACLILQCSTELFFFDLCV